VLNIRTVGCEVAYPPNAQKFHFLYFEIKMWQPFFTTALNKCVRFPVLVGPAVRKNTVYVHFICFFYICTRQRSRTFHSVNVIQSVLLPFCAPQLSWSAQWFLCDNALLLIEVTEERLCVMHYKYAICSLCNCL